MVPARPPDLSPIRAGKAAMFPPPRRPGRDCATALGRWDAGALGRWGAAALRRWDAGTLGPWGAGALGLRRYGATAP